MCLSICFKDEVSHLRIVCIDNSVWQLSFIFPPLSLYIICSWMKSHAAPHSLYPPLTSSHFLPLCLNHTNVCILLTFTHRNIPSRKELIHMWADVRLCFVLLLSVMLSTAVTSPAGSQWENPLVFLAPVLFPYSSFHASPVHDFSMFDYKHTRCDDGVQFPNDDPILHIFLAFLRYHNIYPLRLGCVCLSPFLFSLLKFGKREI